MCRNTSKTQCTDHAIAQMSARISKPVAPKRESSRRGAHGSLARSCCAHAALDCGLFGTGWT